MELKDVLLKRRSCRKYLDKKVPKEYIDVLLHAAMSGPSACNRKPWEFYVIEKEDIISKLNKASMFSKINAPLAIVVCGNLSKALPSRLAPYWIQDCSAATENILLAATDLSLGSVWCGIHPQDQAEERVREILNLDQNIIPLNIIYLGYSAEDMEPRDQYDEGKIHYL